MTKDGTYHKDIGFPSLELSTVLYKTFLLYYSTHARQACIHDRYGVISKPPREITIREINLVEIEIVNGVVVKFVCRLPYDRRFDIVLVVIPETPTGVVKTVWLNEATDKHFTLDRSKYQRP